MRVVADDRGVTWTNGSSLGHNYAGSAVIRADLDGTNRRVLSTASAAFAVVDAPGAAYLSDDTLDGNVSVIDAP